MTPNCLIILKTPKHRCQRSQSPTGPNVPSELSSRRRDWWIHPPPLPPYPTMTLRLWARRQTDDRQIFVVWHTIQSLFACRSRMRLPLPPSPSIQSFLRPTHTLSRITTIVCQHGTSWDQFRTKHTQTFNQEGECPAYDITRLTIQDADETIKEYQIKYKCLLSRLIEWWWTYLHEHILCILCLQGYSFKTWTKTQTISNVYLFI